MDSIAGHGTPYMFQFTHQCRGELKTLVGVTDAAKFQSTALCGGKRYRPRRRYRLPSFNPRLRMGANLTKAAVIR